MESYRPESRLQRFFRKTRSLFASLAALLRFGATKSLCVLRSAFFTLRLRLHLLALSLTNPSSPNRIRTLRLASLASVFLLLSGLALAGLDLPGRTRRALKKNFGIGGPPVLRVETHRIQPKESLWALAKEKNLSFDTLITINKLNNIHSIRVGQEILIPNQDGILYKVQTGESIRSIAEKFGVRIEDIIDVNDLTLSAANSLHTNIELFLPGVRLSQKDRRDLLGMSFIRPVPGRIRSAFGWREDPITRNRRFHTGVDFSCPPGTPVRAAADGQIVFAGTRGGYGVTVILRHPEGYTTLYAHLSRTAVKRGEFIKTGQVIAYSGNTGRTTGPHLHFEVRRYGVHVNPTGVIQLADGKNNRR